MERYNVGFWFTIGYVQYQVIEVLDDMMYVIKSQYGLAREINHDDLTFRMD